MSGFRNAQETGGKVAIMDEGVTLTPRVSSMDFRGAGVTGSVLGSAVTETIPGIAGTAVTSEVPTGAIDDSNRVFVLAHTPIADSLKLYLSGARQQVTGDYALLVATITFVNAPQPGSIILADYNY